MDLDPHRLRTAAHELAHMLVWRASGFPVKWAGVYGYGERTSGRTRLQRMRLDTVEEAQNWLVGLMAGPEAEILWCELNSAQYDDRAEEGDMEKVAWFRRKYGKIVALPADRQLRREARQAVCRRWSEIERLTPQLADRGRLR